MKIKTKFRIAIALTVLLLTGMQVMSQNPANMVMPQIPPSPQAVAFNRLGEYQVNNNYGAPDINIPLWEIDFHGYKIPLSLHYDAQPLKPGYNYDVTGFGWTLSGNSCVSRTIKDVADEKNNYTLESFKLSAGQFKEYLYYEKNNLLDKLNFQYDRYNVVLPSGRSISFFMYKQDKNSPMNYYLVGLDKNVKIECSPTDGTPIKSFTVTDENGIKYIFDKPEKASNIYVNDLTADNYVTWLLTSVNIPSKGKIEYEYTKSVFIKATSVLREPTVTVCRLYDHWSEWPKTRRFNVKGSFQSQNPIYTMSFLKRISYGPTTVDFEYTDLMDYKRPHMNKIVVSDNEETIREFVLDINKYQEPSQLKSLVISGQNDKDKLKYSLGYSTGNPNPGEYTDFWGNMCKAISIKDKNDNTINNHGLDDLGNFNMFFNYEGIGLGWNEIQNQISHDGILAKLIERKEGEHAYYYKMKLQTMTDRETRVPTSPDKHGVLTGISYPNGGFTEFNWENHRFPTATAADGDIVLDRRKQRIIEGGGFRIKSIINHAANGEITSSDYYSYGYSVGDVIHRNFPTPLPTDFDIKDTLNHHTGCGEAVVDPNIFTFMSSYGYSMTAKPGSNSSQFSYAAPNEFRKMLVGIDSRFKDISNSKGIQTWWDVSFSALKFQSLIGGRRPVVYPEITVYHGCHPFEKDFCKSKTVYRYNIYNYQFLDNENYNQEDNYLLTAFDQKSKKDTAYFESLYFLDKYPALSCREYPAERHQLRSRTDYSYNPNSKNWDVVSKDDYEYENHEISKDGYIFESFVSKENYIPNPEGYEYGQYGYVHPLMNAKLIDLYKPVKQYIGNSELIKKTTTNFRQGGCRDGNMMTEEYNYLYSGVIKSQESTSPNEGYKFDWYTYVGEEDDGNSVLKEMKERHILASPTSIETDLYIAEHHNVEIGSKIDYAIYPTTSGSTNILPSKLYESNGTNENDKIIYEPSIEVKSYDDIGNPTEIVDLKTGVHCVYIWDESGRYMAAMIKNAKLADVDAIVSGNSLSRYKSLKTMLPNSQIETWDYKPLIGVSAHTDVSGQTFVYEYDGLGRLKSEKRMVVINNKTTYETIHEYEYNYKNGME